MRREFSAGGVLVRRLRRALDGGGDPAGREAGGALGAPEGRDRPGRGPRGDGAPRGRGGDRRPRAARPQARRRPLRLHLGGRARLQDRQLLPRSATRAGGSATSRPSSRTRSPRCAGSRSRRRRACSPTRASARWPRRRSQRSPTRLYDGRAPGGRWTMYALNFYSPIVESQLRSGRKSATIRLGDKSAEVPEGDDRRGARRRRASAPRKKIFDAVIDKVEVKTLGELSPERDRARQPGDPPGRGHGGLPRGALQPRGLRTRPRHLDPLLRDPVVAGR